MKLRPLISLSLSSLLTLSACSEKIETIREVRGGDRPVPASSQEKVDDRPAFFDFWRETVAGSTPHLGLAKLLRPFIGVSSDNTLPNVSFLDELSRDRRQMQNKILLGAAPYNDALVLNQLWVRKEGADFQGKNFLQQFDVAAQAELQRKAMNSLINAFENRAQALAQQLAPIMLQNVSESDVAKLNSLKGDREKQIQDIIVILKKYDKVLSSYNFDSRDNVKIIMIGMVAGVVADELAKNQTVQNLIQTARRVQDTVALVREMAEFIKVVEDNKQAMKEDLLKAKNSLLELGKDLADMRSGPWLHDSTKAEGMRFINDVLTGNLKEGSGGSFLTQKQRINENLQTFVDSTASSFNSLNRILKATEGITERLGIRLDPSVKQAIQTAQQIGTAVNLAKNLMAAYATGGLVGALEIFGGGGAALFGGGNDAMAADIQEIKRDLKEIKRLQAQILQAQADTMMMIRDLAVMLASYHREEMYLLREVKGWQLLQYEATLVDTHEEIRACQQMAQFSLYTNASAEALFPLGSIETLKLGRSAIYSLLKDKKSINTLVRSLGEDTFKDCQDGMRKAFGQSTAAENPVQLMSSQSEVVPFFRERYRPLLDRLAEVSTNTVFSSMSLHLPARHVRAVDEKALYHRMAAASNLSQIAALQNLVSTQSLERYVEALIVMGPIVSYDKQTWIEFNTNTTALKDGYETAWARSSMWLKNALALTQTAIVQESLIAGEPLLRSEYSRFADILKNNEDCETQSSSFECAVKTNTIFRRNLLMYVLSHRAYGFDIREYQSAFDKKDIATLERFLGLDFKGRITTEKQFGKETLVFVWGQTEKGKEKYTTILPNSAELMSGELQYSENLPKLLEIREKLTEALLEVTPVLIDGPMKEDLIKTLSL